MRTLIEDGLVHVFDGAMGTLLYSRGVFVNACYDELNLSRPELVRGIHEEYVAAGAEILETNTFGANPVKLSSYGLDDRVEAINAAAARLAREAAASGPTAASVAGAIGPLGMRIEPWGPTSRAEAVAFFRRQVIGLLEGGVDGFVLETFADLNEVRCAFDAVRAESDLPIVAQMTVGQDEKTAFGTDAAQIAAALEDMGADVIGLNCSVGPAVMLDAVEDMAETASLPLVAQPNAGLPRTIRDRKIYLASPDYMAQYARRMIDVGVRFVGGCCGTTPDHVKKMREAVGALQPRHVSVRPKARPGSTHAAPVEPVALGERSALGDKMARGATVVSVEIIPPHSWNAEDIVAPARELKAAGVDAVSMLESARARSRMSALAAGLIVEREVGVEAIVHYTCRDKNMFGMISDLLGAAATGIRNILVVSGDPPTMGPYPDSTAVFDIDSIGLTNLVQGLNRGVDPGGNSIGDPTRFVQGVAINQGAVDRKRELERFGYKIEAGADFAVTQPVFDVASLASFLAEAGNPEIPILAGIWPLLSVRNAEFLANEVPGVVVPERVVERMKQANQIGASAEAEEGISLALGVIENARGLVAGFHLSAPSRRTDIAIRVLRESGLRPAS